MVALWARSSQRNFEGVCLRLWSLLFERWIPLRTRYGTPSNGFRSERGYEVDDACVDDERTRYRQVLSLSERVTEPV